MTTPSGIEPVVYARNFSTRIADLQNQSIESQKRTYTKWINSKIKNRRPILGPVQNLFEDLKNGQILLGLLEVFNRKPFPCEKGESRVSSMNNINHVFDHLKNVAKLKLHGITIEGILDGKASMTLGLIWSIIHLYSIQILSSSQKFSQALNASGSKIYIAESSSTSKKKLLKWASKKISKQAKNSNNLENQPPFAEVKKFTNFGNQWRDGKAFANLIYVTDANALGDREEFLAKFRQNSVRENLQMTFDIAEEKLGIEQLLVPEGKYSASLNVSTLHKKLHITHNSYKNTKQITPT